MKILRTAGLVMMGTAGILFAGEADRRTLNDCIAVALKASPDVRSASARLDAARSAIKEAASAYYPQVGLAGNWMRTDNPPQAFFMSLNQRRASLQNDFNHPEDTDNARGSVVAQWRVFDSGRREADRQAATFGARASEQSLAAVRNDLVYEITKAYYGILQVRGFVTVQEEAANSISESLRVATERFKAGGAMKTDVLNLEVQKAQADEELIRARNGLKLSVAALNAAVGVEWLKPADVDGLASRTDPADWRDQSGSQTIESRPEWRAMESQVGMAEALATRARREYLPVVNAFGSVDWDSESFGGAERSYLAGAAIELNVFDGFRTRAGVAKAASALIAAQAQADKLKAMLALDLTRARLNVQEAGERMVVAGKALAGAGESLRITQERYKQGAAMITELMAAQAGFTATRIRNVAARFDWLIARADVERASGELGEKWACQNPESRSQNTSEGEDEHNQ